MFNWLYQVIFLILSRMKLYRLSDNNSTFLYRVNDFLKNTNQNREN